MKQMKMEASKKGVELNPATWPTVQGDGEEGRWQLVMRRIQVVTPGAKRDEDIPLEAEEVVKDCCPKDNNLD